MTKATTIILLTMLILGIFLVGYLSMKSEDFKKNTNLPVLPEFSKVSDMSGYLAFKNSNDIMVRRMRSLSSKYMSEKDFDMIFSVVIPVETKEPNIFLWQTQMMIKLHMHAFLDSLKKTGGQFYVSKNTLIDVSDVLVDLIHYVPDGMWTYDFMLILSIHNRINSGTKSVDKEAGIFTPLIPGIDFSNLTVGVLQPIVNEGLDHRVKLAWNSGWTEENYENRQLDNAYGETVSIPWRVMSETDELGYMSYIYNDLANQALNHFNPVSRPYSTGNLDENMFYDQTIALRRQDFNRRLNEEKQGLYSPSGVSDILSNYAESNDGSMDGFSGYLTRVREELFDCAESRRVPQLSGWFFYIKYIQGRGQVIDNGFPSIVSNQKISSENLLEIKRLEGAVKPVERPTATPRFGGCRSVSTCRKCRSSCTTANCNKLRAHAAVDFYGRPDASVRAVSDGIAIGVSPTFFADMCSPGGIGDASCPPGYTCQGSYCKRDRDGQKHYLPAITIKHVDGTLGRYGEFPLVDGMISGREVQLQETIGNIVVYTNQCHFEIYSGEVDIVPWISGGNPYFASRTSLQDITEMKTNFLSTLSVTASPPSFVPDNALEYRYVPTPNYCIPNCDYNCMYNRRCDLMNPDPTVDWNARSTD